MCVRVHVCVCECVSVRKHGDVLLDQRDHVTMWFVGN